MAIIGNLPYNLTNGTTADATQVMADLNTIINGVNTNAAAITSVQQDSYNYVADAGTVNNLIISMTPSPVSYTDGLWGRTKAANTNTSTTVTVKFGSLGTKNVVIDQAGTLPAVGSIISGMHYIFEYDSTQDKCILLNPSRSLSSYTITLNGMTGTTTGTINTALEGNGKMLTQYIIVNITGTSNSTSMGGTGVPSYALTTSAVRVGAGIIDNNSGFWGGNTTPGSSTYTFEKTYGAGSTSFTSSGTKGLLNSKVVYSLD